MNYVQNVINALTPWWTAVTIICYVLGILFFVLSGKSAIQSSREKHSLNYLWTFIVSVLLLNLPAILDSVTLSMFKQNSLHELSYTSSAPNVGEYITFSIRAVMLIGLIGVIRGLNFLRDTTQRAKDIPKATTHIIGGTLAINIVQFLYALGATVGGDVQSYIQTIL